MAKDQIDQDALAAEWGVALDAEKGAAPSAEPAPGQDDSETAAMAAQWGAMVDDGQFIQTAKGGAERILTQEEIDSLLGFERHAPFGSKRVLVDLILRHSLIRHPTDAVTAPRFP